MNISLRLTKLEAATKPQRRNLITIGLVGRTDDEITGADLFGVMYQRGHDESVESFIQRLDDCPNRLPVAVAMMTYAEVTL